MREGSAGSSPLSSARLWLSLSVPSDPAELQLLVAAALQTNCPLDVSSQPALWGHYLRGSDCRILAVGNLQLSRATGFNHAADLVAANMLETLCAVGRETLDCFFLPVTREDGPEQVRGAVHAITQAKAEGNLLNVGLYAAEDAASAVQHLQRHEVFNVFLAQRNHSSKELLDWPAVVQTPAHVHTVTCSPFNWGLDVPFFEPSSFWRLDGSHLAERILQSLALEYPVLLGVRTATEIEQALAALASEPAPISDEDLAIFRAKYGSAEHIRALQENSHRALAGRSA